VFWRDEESNWRLVQGSPSDYLALQYRRLTPEQRRSAAGAYVLFSLGTTQHGSNELGDAAATYQKILSLSARGKSTELEVLTLFQLSQLFIKQGDETQTTVYLQKYALAISHVIDRIGYQPIVKTVPKYPRRALERFTRGSVVVSFDVATDGTTRNIKVLDESPRGVGFGKAAAKAAETFRYVPAVENGELVTAHGVQNRMDFSFTFDTARR